MMGILNSSILQSKLIGGKRTWENCWMRMEIRIDVSMDEVAAKYFTKLFTSSNSQNFHHIFQNFQPRVTEVMNKALIRTVTKDEVFSINPSKAPGPYGMTGVFFQQYWSIVGDKLTAEIQEFFENGKFQE